MKHKHENNRGANEDSAELGKEGLKPLESARAPELEPIPGREATETDAERAADEREVLDVHACFFNFRAEEDRIRGRAGDERNRFDETFGRCRGAGRKE